MPWRFQRALLVGALLAVVCATGPAAFAETPSPALSQRSRQALDDWFYGQRRYGLGHIPDDAVLKALEQRTSMLRNSFVRQDASDTSAVPANQWVPIGPTVINSPTRGLITGRITSLALDPNNPSTVYVAAAGGGVWKSTNRGSNWSPLTDSLPSLASGAVAVDPFTGELWYGTGELNFCRDCYYGAGLYRSADGGASWNRAGADTFLSSPTSAIVFDRRNQGTLFVGRSSALWRSADDGQTWHATLLGTITDFALNPTDSTIAYAAAGNAFGAPENGVYRSTDGGQTWARLGGGLPDQATIGRIALAIDPSSPSTVYALIARSSDFTLNGLFRSVNNGNTWTKISSLPPDVFLEAQFAVGIFSMVVAVDPRNPATLYIGGNDLWKSTDNGATWQPLNIADGQHGLFFDPSDPQTFYLINDSGVWRSSNGGLSFTSLNNTLSVTQLQTVALHPTNPDISIGSTQENGTIVYGGGFAWDQGRLGDGGTAFFEAFNPQTIYASGHYFDLFRSDDGGKTWPLLRQTINPADRVQFYAPFVLVPGQLGWLYFGTQRVWFSSDRGDHWAAMSGDLTKGGSATITTLSIGPHAPQVIYAGTSDAQVQVSLDGGRNWSLAAPLPNRYITSLAVHPLNPFQAYVGLSGFGTGHVFRTDDRGGSWIDVSANLPDVPVNAILIDAVSPDKIYLGTDIGVFVLGTDGNWSPLNQGMPNMIVLGLSQNPVTGALVAATHGRGAFSLAASFRAPHMDALLNSASLAQAPLAPGMAVNLVGLNLAPGAAAVPSLPFPLPYSLAGSTVTVNGVTAPLNSAAPGQISFLVPYGIAGPVVEVTVLNSSGQATVRVPRLDSSPGIFQTAGEGNIFHANGTGVSDAAPTRAGEELVLYANGLGAVDQSVSSGSPSPSNPPAKTLVQPIVRVGGVQAAVNFSGLTPNLIATYQVNFVVPPGLTGKVPVQLDMGNGITSNTVQMSTGQ